ncbi:MAG: calcium/sodium antiporter [Anaeroplasmataceae bacterium]|nr:calcium/sodium antiporter [Anaeroplasmataceae bacterium]
MILAETLSGLGYFLNLLFLIIGVVFLVKGADFFVASASSIAKKFKISALVIGLTVVSFGTSAPELAVSLTSSIKGNSGLALGNVVGSNIANLALVLGCSALISPIVVKRSICKREFPFLLASTMLLIIFSFDNLFSGYRGVENILSRGEALIFIAGIALFCYISIVLAKKDAQKSDPLNTAFVPEQEEIKELPLKKTIILLIVGLAGIVVGAEFVTTPASNIATSIGISLGVEKSLMTNLVGLTVVAIGTSLPELVTSVMAAKRGENEIAVGNVVGSNIFNILFICGLSGVITPLTMTADIMTDMILSLALSVLVLYFSKKGTLKRSYGGILLGCYAVYLIYIIVRLFYPFIVIPS